jgi:hypothetical protein
LPPPVNNQPCDEPNARPHSDPVVLPVILYSDTEKSLFDAEKQGILDFLTEFGDFQIRPQWAIQQQESNAQREKFLTEPERYVQLNAENEAFRDFNNRLKLFLI